MGMKARKGSAGSEGSAGSDLPEGASSPQVDALPGGNVTVSEGLPDGSERIVRPNPRGRPRPGPNDGY